MKYYTHYIISQKELVKKDFQFHFVEYLILSLKGILKRREHRTYIHNSIEHSEISTSFSTDKSKKLHLIINNKIAEYMMHSCQLVQILHTTKILWNITAN